MGTIPKPDSDSTIPLLRLSMLSDRRGSTLSGPLMLKGSPPS
jgi:hypothetical protein